MDLAQAMLSLVGALAPPVTDPDPTVRIHQGLLQVLAGRHVAGVAEADAQLLRTWLQRAYGDRPDPEAALYQDLLDHVMVREGADQFAVRRERGAHRATGAYYTNTTVVRYMIGRACDYLPGARSTIDPACGAGAFLEEARSQFGQQLRLAGLDTDPVALALCARNVPGADLHAMDTLLEPFPGGYDLCMGNPPYISTGLRGAAAPDCARLDALRHRYPATAQYKLNTYPLFVERGLELVRPGGILGYILPDSFLSGRYFEGMRRLLLSHTLLELTLLRDDFWQHGHVGQSVILLVRRGQPPPGHHVAVRVCGGVDELALTPAVPVAVADLVWGPRQRFRLVPDPGLRAFVRSMESSPGATPLGALVRTYSGLIGRQGQRSLLRSANPALTGPWGRLLRSGREIDRYQLNWGGEEVSLDPALIKSGGHTAYYRQPKLMLRQTADSLRAVYDDQGFYCLNNIHVLVPRAEGIKLHMLLAILNSRPVNRYYQAMTMESGRLYPQVDLDLLDSLPVPPIEDVLATRLAELAWKRQCAASDEAAHLDREIDAVTAACYGEDG
ncbi:MAG: type restriction m6 adenine methyltransferase, Alw26I/Eco31I/Esp3I family [Firmicutes bacterium]|nr:type restriction m6 adenine methyltransferase, Alw26I/Eco31I/Esp3I family [Bacillota bacterium]